MNLHKASETDAQVLTAYLNHIWRQFPEVKAWIEGDVIRFTNSALEIHTWTPTAHDIHSARLWRHNSPRLG